MNNAGTLASLVTIATIDDQPQEFKQRPAGGPQPSVQSVTIPSESQAAGAEAAIRQQQPVLPQPVVPPPDLSLQQTKYKASFTVHIKEFQSQQAGTSVRSITVGADTVEDFPIQLWYK
ncbi:hypothetical protein HDV05_008152, partial [Chytridiales sp. JEL 0842]